MKKILLNWLPPAMVNFASPSMSVLKGYLHKNGYQVQVKYWNIALNSKIEEFFNFQKLGQDVDIYKFMPVLTYLSVEKDDRKLQERLCNTILMLKPQLNSKPRNFVEDYIHRYFHELNAIIDTEIDSCNLEDYLYLGFSAQFSQWIFADVIIKRILKKKPQITLVSGGSGTEKQARAMLGNFNYYRYAFWGESEHSLLQLTRYLDDSCEENLDLADIPNIA